MSTVSDMGVSQGHLARRPLNSTIWNGTDTFRIVAVRSAQFDKTIEKVARGDSGGPVYEIIDSPLNTVALVGIQWGLISNTDNQPRALYGPFSSVESELGNLSVCSDPTFC